MRNGLNTGNMSELVHEIRSNPLEAQFRYSVASELGCSGDAIARVQTLAGGSIRIARPFEFYSNRDRDAQVARTSQEYLLTALGGCAMITFLLGCSARAVSLSALGMDVYAEVPEAGPLRNVNYCFDIEADVDRTVLSSLARHVACFSPNHRTFTDGNEVRVIVSGVTPHDERTGQTVRPTSVASPERGPVSPVSARLDWQYGTQIRACTSWSGRTRDGLWVDQPKQALGLDRAPNPQEYLLGSLNAELLHRLGSVNSDLVKTIVQSSGKIDLRGLLNVDPAAPTRVHELELSIGLRRAVAEADIARIQQAVSACGTYQTICERTSVSVAVKQGGQELDRFITDHDFVRKHLSSLEHDSPTGKE